MEFEEMKKEIKPLAEKKSWVKKNFVEAMRGLYVALDPGEDAPADTYAIRAGDYKVVLRFGDYDKWANGYRYYEVELREIQKYEWGDEEFEKIILKINPYDENDVVDEDFYAVDARKFVAVFDEFIEKLKEEIERRNRLYDEAKNTLEKILEVLRGEE